MGDYETLLKEYYAIEDSVLREAADRLAVGHEAGEGMDVLQEAIRQTRSWMLEALQEQEKNMGELSQALNEARDALRTTQERMDGMERENKQATAILFQSRGLNAKPAAVGPDIQLRLEQQEVLLKRRESELTALRLKLWASQRELDGLFQRLKAQESASPPPAPVPEIPSEETDRIQAELSALKASLAQAEDRRQRAEQRIAAIEAERARIDSTASGWEAELVLKSREIESLRAQVQEAQAKSAVHAAQAAELDAKTKEIAALTTRMQQAEGQSASLKERMEALKAAQAVSVNGDKTDEESRRMKERLVELERSLRHRDDEFEALRHKLEETELFCDGFLKRIQSLEVERAKVQAYVDAVVSAKPKDAPPDWEKEKAELQERLTVMQRDLSNMRRAQEFNERQWVETMTHQDMERLKEIDILKAEIDRLRNLQKAGGPMDVTDVVRIQPPGS